MAHPQPIPRTTPPDPGPLGPPPPLFERAPAAPPLFFGGLLLLLVVGVAALVWPSSPPPLPDDELAALVAQEQRDFGLPTRSEPVDEVGRAQGAAGAGYAAGGPSLAELRLTVDGADATVWIDGERAGSTPLHLDPVAAGPREVRVSRGEATLMDTVLYIRSGALVHFHVVEPTASAAANAGRQAPARTARRSASQRPPAQAPPPRNTRPRVGW